MRYFVMMTAFAAMAADDAAPAVEGSWKVTAAVRDGIEVPEDKRAKMAVTFAGSDMTLTYPGGEDKAKAEFTPAAKHLTFVTPEGKALGMYELTGDELKLCWAYPGNDRPKEFASKGSGVMFLTLQREKK